MRILILGGTGAMGTYLVQILKQKNCELIIPELSEPPVRTLGATIPENESHIFR